jgi:hypothetical protein
MIAYLAKVLNLIAHVLGYDQPVDARYDNDMVGTNIDPWTSLNWSKAFAINLPHHM